MKKIIIVYIIAWTIISLSLYCINLKTELFNTYQVIQGTLFSAFLTMGSFMLSLVSLFLGTIKDRLFDNNTYIERTNSAKILNISKDGRYKRLANISNLFIFCITMCFICSLMQLACIFFQNNVSQSICLEKTLQPICLVNIFQSICLAIVITTIFLALFILYNVWKTVNIWLQILNQLSDDN